MTDEMKNSIINQINNGESVSIDYIIDDIPYVITFMSSSKEMGINIPSILAIPQVKDISNQIVFEANNLESEEFSRIFDQACQTGFKLAKLTKEKPAPILVPLIPSNKNAPYLQQLSKECFQLSSDNSYYKIDEQIKKMIEYTRIYLLQKYSIPTNKKIFINGYSSSGVFAQRFALLHPELIDTACIGGASGSIPVPSKEIGYPIGISDYESLFGKKFDFDDYLAIKFRYYVGELELNKKAEGRFDEDGHAAPMHDMSYFNRSVPTEVGKIQREIFGKNMFERVDKTLVFLKYYGFDINHKIFEGKTHNSIDGQPVKEMGDLLFKEIYLNRISDEKNVNL